MFPCKVLLRCQGCSRATVHGAGQDVSVIPCYSERVVHSPITAPLILEQQARVVKCCEFDKSIIFISKNAPIWLEGRKFCKTRSSTTCNYMYRSTQGAPVIFLLLVGTYVLQHKNTANSVWCNNEYC